MIDIAWILICAVLVALMQPGFMCLESGLTRSKNSINVAVKNLADFGISTLLFWAIGYGLMFGDTWYGWIGTQQYFFQSPHDHPFGGAFFIFQMMFCGTAVTIISGAVAERMKFSSYLIVAIFVSGLIYPLFGHWAWNCSPDSTCPSGWLGQRGFIDFAGSTVVHSIGGWVSLAILLIIGPREGRFPTNGPPHEIRGHNIPLAILGIFLLWIGWFGFNGGSTLALNAQVGHILINTTIAAAAGMIVATFLEWSWHRQAKVEALMNGCLAGLVAITASCHAVTALAALFIGAIGGILMIATKYLLNHWRIDDAVDAIPVHAAGGIWGTLAVAFFAAPEFFIPGTSRWEQFWIQLQGVMVAFIWAFGLSFIILKWFNTFFPLRLSIEEERIGLNVSEHGVSTEFYDLLESMQVQIKTGDMNLRVHEEPYTDVGSIARQYNRVLDKLSAKTEKVRKMAQITQLAKQEIEQAHQEIIVLNERLKAENMRMSAELEVTRRLQQMVLPRKEELERISGLDIAGFMEPAEEVGGDYYDILQHEQGIKIGIGDVTGHGLESGVLMIMVQTAVRALLANDEKDPVRFLKALNQTIYGNVQRMNCDKNLSLVLIDYQGGILSLTGQHEEMIIVRAGGRIERIDTINLGFPIGLEEDISEFIGEIKIQLNSGDVVVLYTDGITEAQNKQREQFGIKRLCKSISDNWRRTAAEIRQMVVDELRYHIGTHKIIDDITLVVIKQK
ncbi:MAG: ammonium transporter [Beggiatoa sp. IS2]|nr:MAG: ammonium transporter [Beggiatoa sp. IS2]